MLASRRSAPVTSSPTREYVRGSAGHDVVDASIVGIERGADGLRVTADATTEGRLSFTGDDVILATGSVPARRPPRARCGHGAQRPRPALSRFWESVSVPGIFFAGNITIAPRGLAKEGVAANLSP